MIIFALAVFLLIITPGPGVLSAAGVGASFGFRLGLYYLFGLFLGTNLVSILVVTGVSTIIMNIPFIRFILIILSSFYLLILAYLIAFSGGRIALIKNKFGTGIIGGLFLQLLNPKAYAVNTSLFTSFAFLPEDIIIEILLKFFIMNMIWLPIHILWLYFGIVISELNISNALNKKINLVMASSLVIVVFLSIISLYNV